MAKNNDIGDLKKTSCSVHIKKENVEKYNSIKEKSSFVSKLINNYIDGSLIELNLPDDIAQKFREDATKDWLIPKLLIEYYNNNIMFVSDFLRAKNLTQTSVILNQEYATKAELNNSTNIVTDTSVKETLNTESEEEEIAVDLNSGEEDINNSISESRVSKVEDEAVTEEINKVTEQEKTNQRKVLFARKK